MVGRQKTTKWISDIISKRSLLESRERRVFFPNTKIMSKLESKKKLNIYCETVKVEIESEQSY